MSWQDMTIEYSLKISEIHVSELEEAFRLDAEYYSPENLENERKLQAKGFVPLGSLANRIDVGYVGSMVAEYLETGVPMLQTQNVQQFFLDMKDCKYVDKTFHAKLKKSQINFGDILIARSGSFGNASVYLEHESINSADIIIVEAQAGKVNPFYLVAFLNSLYGRSQLYRFASGGLQGHVNLTILEKLKISLASSSFQKLIEKVVLSSYRLRREAEDAYAAAEKLFLSQLSLVNYVFSGKSISVRSVAEAAKTHRFDAEYWQPRYDDIIAKIRSNKGGMSSVGSEYGIVTNNFKSKTDTTYSYIEIGDVATSGGEVTFSQLAAEELPANAKILFSERQLIASKVRPNRGAVAILGDHEGFVGSGAFCALQQKKEPLEILLAFLKAEPVRELLMRYNVGTSYPVIRDEDILSLPFPIIEADKKIKIVEGIRRSQDQWKESRVLIERAKRAVEVFIESDEAKALSFLVQ